MKAIGRGSVASFLTVLLNVAWYVVGLALVLTLGIMAASPFLDLSAAEMDIPVSFTIDAGHKVAAPALGIDNARIVKVSGSLIFPPRGGIGLLGPLAVVAGMILIALWVLWELRALFRAVRDGHPFAPANAARVRRVAWLVMLSEPLRVWVVYSAHSFAATYFSSPGLRFYARPAFNLLAIVTGLIILVIAEVFAAGTRLDEDQSLTI